MRVDRQEGGEAAVLAAVRVFSPAGCLWLAHGMSLISAAIHLKMKLCLATPSRGGYCLWRETSGLNCFYVNVCRRRGSLANHVPIGGSMASAGSGMSNTLVEID